MLVHILGAGIAGLTLAHVLDRRGKSWRLYEKAPAVGAEASGKNAGIIRTYEVDPVMRGFAVPSFGYYRDTEPGFVERGLILLPWEVDYSEKTISRRLFSHKRRDGLFLPQNGTLEPMPLLQRLAAQKFQYGSIEFNFAAQFEGRAGRIFSETMPLKENDIVVVACGEGSVGVAEKLGFPLGLIAHRRTLYEFKAALGSDGPVEWDEESGVYFRPYGDNFLATAGEQTPAAQDTDDDPAPDEKKLAILERELPFFHRANLLSTRACRRLTPLDNRPIVGRDTQIENLFWFTGLGGRGISTAPALAEALAGLICGEPAQAIVNALSPGRMLAKF